MSDQLVLVTGATSYIGSHIINYHLQAGWKVRGTVRSLTSKKTKALQQCFTEYAENLELVEADLKKTDVWDTAVKGCTYVYHTACPIEADAFCKNNQVKYLKEPAEVKQAIATIVQGTVCVLNAAKAAGVKRSVMTSSIAAMIPAGWTEVMYPYHSNVKGAYDPAAYMKTFNEDVWSDERLVDGYLLAKTVSEKEAWKVVEGSSMELAIINPSYVIGPSLHKDLAADSLVIIDTVMQQPPGAGRQMPGLADISMPCVDVRDVAKAHVKAMLLPEAAGNRYLCVNKAVSAYDMQALLGKVFDPMGYTTKQAKVSKCLVGLLGLCNPIMARIHLNWAKYPKLDNQKLRRDLLPELIDIETSIIETVEGSVAVGRYERRPGFKTDKPEFQGNADHISIPVTL